MPIFTPITPTTTVTARMQVNSPYKVFFPSDEYGAYTGGLTSATLNVWIYVGEQGNANTLSSGDNVDASIAGASGSRANAPSKSLKSSAVGNLNEEFVSFDIANIVKSQLKQDFSGEDIDSTATVNPNTIIWVDYQLTTKVSGVTTIHPLFRCLGLDGYTYFEEGFNAQLDYVPMISADTISVVEGEEAFIPMLKDTYTAVTFYTNAGGVVPSAAASPSSEEYSYEQIQYIGAANADYITISYTEDGISKTKTLNINTLACNKHTPYRVSFLNRFGAIESLWFNGNNTESTMVKSKEYSRVTTSSINGAEYSNSRGSRYKQRQSSTKAMTLNSGFYPESSNVTFEELIDSTETWIEKDGVILPINIKASSFNKKTEINDNAINYTINIEFAFNKINNI
tara:strand:+ start:12 stop:1205 length:1194 start_codon:yes stop_codon:yes gene_type:complete